MLNFRYKKTGVSRFFLHCRINSLL
ncbi:hypothetical protein VCHENC02_0177A, partial [Vibrio harveyi]